MTGGRCEEKCGRKKGKKRKDVGRSEGIIRQRLWVIEYETAASLRSSQ